MRHMIVDAAWYVVVLLLVIWAVWGTATVLTRAAF